MNNLHLLIQSNFFNVWIVVVFFHSKHVFQIGQFFKSLKTRIQRYHSNPIHQEFIPSGCSLFGSSLFGSSLFGKFTLREFTLREFTLREFTLREFTLREVHPSRSLLFWGVVSYLGELQTRKMQTRTTRVQASEASLLPCRVRVCVNRIPCEENISCKQDCDWLALNLVSCLNRIPCRVKMVSAHLLYKIMAVIGQCWT